MSKPGFTSTIFAGGVAFGVLVTIYMQRSEAEQLRTSLALAQQEASFEKTARKVFSDGMIGCFDRLGKDKQK